MARSIIFAMFVVLTTGFTVPSVDILVYEPQGFQVIVQHVDGLQLFAFHANVNRTIGRRAAGSYFFDSTSPVNGTWSYYEKKAFVEKGDVIYYWVYFQHDKFGYSNSGVFNVTELITDPFPEESRYPPPPSVGVEEETVLQSFAPSASLEGNQDYKFCAANLTTCERTVLKVTHKLVEIDTTIENLKKTNALLKNIIERNPDGRKLTLSGRISREDNPITVVKFILNEKLNLSPTVLSALRNSDLSITFELSTVDEIISVISEAKNKLENSKSVSINY